MKKICLDFKQIKKKKIARPVLHIALSQVTSLLGLFILGHFKGSESNEKYNAALKELNKLRT